MSIEAASDMLPLLMSLPFILISIFGLNRMLKWLEERDGKHQRKQ